MKVRSCDLPRDTPCRSHTREQNAPGVCSWKRRPISCDHLHTLSPSAQRLNCQKGGRSLQLPARCRRDDYTLHTGVLPLVSSQSFRMPHQGPRAAGSSVSCPPPFPPFRQAKHAATCLVALTKSNRAGYKSVSRFLQGHNTTCTHDLHHFILPFQQQSPAHPPRKATRNKPQAWRQLTPIALLLVRSPPRLLLRVAPGCEGFA